MRKKVINFFDSFLFFTTNHSWLVFIGCNLKPKLILLFCLPLTTNNNLPFKICCENIVNIIFLFYIFYKNYVKTFLKWFITWLKKKKKSKSTINISFYHSISYWEYANSIQTNLWVRKNPRHIYRGEGNSFTFSKE